MILLDTHIVVWLYARRLDGLPQAVLHRLNREPLAISPFVHLELDYLFESGKTMEPAAKVTDELGARIELAVADSSFAVVCAAARELTWTRDPFDRLIAGHASAADMPLVTKDRTILANFSLAWWGD